MRHPEVFTEFNADNEVVPAVGHKHEVIAKRDRAAEQVDVRAWGGRSRSKPAALVKFPVGGQKRLGHDPQQGALTDDRRAVKQLALNSQRQADQDKPRKPSGGMADEVFQASQRGLLEGLVVKQVGTGIAGQTQLGKNQDGDILVLGALHQGQDTPGVKATVGNPDGRRSRRDPNKSKPAWSVNGTDMLFPRRWFSANR